MQRINSDPGWSMKDNHPVKTFVNNRACQVGAGCHATDVSQVPFKKKPQFSGVTCSILTTSLLKAPPL